MRRILFLLLVLVLSFGYAGQASAEPCMFYNPIFYQGEDPSIIFHDGFYYYVKAVNNGLDSGVELRKAAYLTDFAKTDAVRIWTVPASGPTSKDIWAPELTYYGERWYVYFAADDGVNAHHRMYVLQSDTADPMGTWTFKGKIGDSTDKWAIDGTLFSYQDRLYMVWSGWPGDKGDFPQNLYIAPMSDPLTISGPRVLISEPTQLWEKSVAAINEGPEVLQHDGRLFVLYSADASWKPAYKLGMLTFSGGDPLDAKNWVKNPTPVFEQYTDKTGSVFGPGHATFTQSPDGKQDWIVYHAKLDELDGWAKRDIRAQSFTWKADGSPDFGHPIPANNPVELPSGQPCTAGEMIVDNDDPRIQYDNSWQQLSQIPSAYAGDLQFTAKNGAAYSFTFTGTGIEIIAPKNPTQGKSEVYIDGALQATLDLKSTKAQPQQSVYRMDTLSNGQHTLKVVKKDGPTLILDALKVYGAG
jgi:GH43 family beta-xylosidase